MTPWNIMQQQLGSLPIGCHCSATHAPGVSKPAQQCARSRSRSNTWPFPCAAGIDSFPTAADGLHHSRAQLDRPSGPQQQLQCLHSWQHDRQLQQVRAVRQLHPLQEEHPHQHQRHQQQHLQQSSQLHQQLHNVDARLQLHTPEQHQHVQLPAHHNQQQQQQHSLKVQPVHQSHLLDAQDHIAGQQQQQLDSSSSSTDTPHQPDNHPVYPPAAPTAQIVEAGAPPTAAATTAEAGEPFLLRLLQCQPPKLTSLTAREPRLLTASPQQLQTALVQLAGLLRVPPPKAAAAARKHPQLLFTPSHALVAQLSALQDLLGLSRSQALPLVLQKPGLLLATPVALSRRLAALRATLKLSRARATQLATRAPTLLQECSAATAAAKVAVLQEGLGMKQRDVVVLLVRAPALLDYSVTALQAKISYLHQMVEAVPTRASEEEAEAAAEAAAARDRPEVQQRQEDTAAIIPSDTTSSSSSDNSSDNTSSSSESSSSDTTSSGSGVCGVQRHVTREVRRLVDLEPGLLTRSPEHLRQQLAELSGLTGLCLPQVGSLVAARPALLTRSTKAVTGSWRALSVWHLTPEVKEQLIEEHPLLLRLSSRELHGRCRWLRSLMTRNGRYHVALRSLPPSRLGALLLHLPAAWTRLEFLLQSGREGAVSLSRAVWMGEEAFCKQFPEYMRWKTWVNGEEQAREAPWRVEQKKEQQQRMQQKQRRDIRRRAALQTAQHMQQNLEGTPLTTTPSPPATSSSEVCPPPHQQRTVGTVSVPVGRLRAQKPVRVTVTQDNSSNDAAVAAAAAEAPGSSGSAAAGTLPAS